MRVMGDRLQLHPTSVTNIVDRLQADGWSGAPRTPPTGGPPWWRSPKPGRPCWSKPPKSVTAIDFGLSGLDREEEDQLTELLGRVRQAAGDFA